MNERLESPQGEFKPGDIVEVFVGEQWIAVTYRGKSRNGRALFSGNNNKKMPRKTLEQLIQDKQIRKIFGK